MPRSTRLSHFVASPTAAAYFFTTSASGGSSGRCGFGVGNGGGVCGSVTSACGLVRPRWHVLHPTSVRPSNCSLFSFSTIEIISRAVFFSVFSSLAKFHPSLPTTWQKSQCTPREARIMFIVRCSS